MRQRKDGLWEDTIPRQGKSPKHFYGKTKAELKKKMAAWNESVESPHLDIIIDKWLTEKQKEVEYKTLEGYKAPISRIKDYFGNVPITEIEPAQIQAFIKSIAKQGYKRSTVQRPLDVMRMIFDFAITLPNSKITFNPCSSVKIPSGLDQDNRELADSKDIDIIRNSVDLDFGLFAYFLLYTGMRKAEALAIMDSDIHDGRIYINKAISWQPNQPIIKNTKTNSSIRSIILLDPLKVKIPKFNGYLFSADGGKSPLTQIEFRHRWEKYCKTAGLGDYTIETHVSNKHIYEKKVWKYRIVPHQLRHEFATLCLDAGLDPMDTKKLMGHSKIETTNKIYQHIRDSRRESSESKLNALVNRE